MKRTAMIAVFFLVFMAGLLFGLPRTLPTAQKTRWVSQVFLARLPSTIHVEKGEVSLWPSMRFEAQRLGGIPSLFRESKIRAEWVYFDLLQGRLSPKVTWEVVVPDDQPVEAFFDRSVHWFTRNARNLGAFELVARRRSSNPFMRLSGRIISSERGEFRGEFVFSPQEKTMLGVLDGTIKVRGGWSRDLSRLRLKWSADASDLHWKRDGFNHYRGSPAQVEGELTTERGELTLARVQVDAWAGSLLFQKSQESDWWLEASGVEASQILEGVETGSLTASGVLEDLRVEVQDMTTSNFQKFSGSLVLNRNQLKTFELQGELSRTGQISLKRTDESAAAAVKIKGADLGVWSDGRVKGMLDFSADYALNDISWTVLTSDVAMPFKGRVTVSGLESGSIAIERFVTESWRAVPLSKTQHNWPPEHIAPWKIETLSAEVERLDTSKTQVALRQIQANTSNRSGFPFEGFLVLDLEQETLTGTLQVRDPFDHLKWRKLSRRLLKPVPFELNLACKWNAPCASIGKGKDQVARAMRSAR